MRWQRTHWIIWRLFLIVIIIATCINNVQPENISRQQRKVNKYKHIHGYSICNVNDSVIQSITSHNKA